MSKSRLRYSPFGDFHKSRGYRHQKICCFCLIYSFLISLVLVFFLPIHLEIHLLGTVTDRTVLLREQNLSLYVRPGEDTFLVDVSHQSLKLDQKLGVGTFVCSHPKDRDRRRNIRLSWGQRLRPKPVFILGRSNNDTENLMAMDEARLFQDIVIEDFLEDYKNLTIKTTFALKHFLRLTPSMKYFLKIDDDVLLNVWNLEKIMYKYRDCQGVIGSKEPIRSVQRDKENKWHVPVWMYPHEKFPYFVNGPAYLVTGSIVKDIFSKAMETPLITLEDVFLTGIVAHNALNYTIFDEPGFRQYPYFELDKLCYFRSSVTVHRVTDSEEIHSAWRHLQDDHEPCWDFNH